MWKSSLIKSKQRIIKHGEVFTPPHIVNVMLDLVKPETERIDSRFLEPACGTGNFLVEILRRKLDVVKKRYAKSQQGYEGYAMLAVSSLYGIDILADNVEECRQRLYQIFNDAYTVLFGEQPQATCRAMVRYVLDRNIVHGDTLLMQTVGDDPQPIMFSKWSLKNGAFHEIVPQIEWRYLIKFDVIISNPPYQLSDGGYGRSATPIYHHFINQAKDLKPHYIIMIIPSRWFAGGKRLDEFRKTMLNDDRLRYLVDYENHANVFPDVKIAGGICYFLWDRDYHGLCEVTNFYNGSPVTTQRKLNEFPVFIRHSHAIPIIRKVLARNENGGRRLSESISPSTTFGLPTNYKPKSEGIPCWFKQRIGLQYANPKDVKDRLNILNKWKLLIPCLPNINKTDFSKPHAFYCEQNTRIAKPGVCCTQTWLVACAFDTREEVESFKSYLFTKIVRFLLLQAVISQHVKRKCFYFVPDLGKYEGTYTDEMLKERWGITDEELTFIESRIK